MAKRRIGPAVRPPSLARLTSFRKADERKYLKISLRMMARDRMENQRTKEWRRNGIKSVHVGGKLAATIEVGDVGGEGVTMIEVAVIDSDGARNGRRQRETKHTQRLGLL